MTSVQQLGSVRWQWDVDGVVTVTLDDPGRTANMVNQRHLDGLGACLDELTADKERLRGVVLTSGKRSFFSGPDFVPGEITAEEAAGTYGRLVPFRDQLRRLETLGRPVAVAINGSALGGGFEITLACHYRVGASDPRVIWALAETGMGLIPGAGGTVRVTRMAGIRATVEDIVGPGTVFHPAEALAAGLVDELADDPVAAARRWVLAQDDGAFVQRWERRDHRIPGGMAEERSPVRAVEAVREVANRTATMDPDEAFEVETAAIRGLLESPEFPGLSYFFYALRTLADVRPPDGDGVIREFRPAVAHPLAEVFFGRDAPVREIVGGGRLDGGIPVLIEAGRESLVQALLDAGPDPDDQADAAQRLLDAGLIVDPAGADVASVLVAGFPAEKGGVLHYLAGRQAAHR